jgi:hypothetical protein
MLQLSARDRDLLRLLDRTPATTPLIQKGSLAFAGESFRDERRARERLQYLSAAGFVRAWPLAVPGGGVMNCYKLTPTGFAALHGEGTLQPARAFFAEIAPSRVDHTLAVAEVLVHALVAAHEHQITLSNFHRENELLLQAGPHEQRPDFHTQLLFGGRTFNVLFEIDRGTESVDSLAEQAIRQKLVGYEAYQDLVWRQWKAAAEPTARPYFRVVFLTRSQERANHILWLARACARNRDRRLVYAATQDAFLAERDALRIPFWNDHHGAWQALVNLQPTGGFLRSPIRLTSPRVPGRGI